MSMLRATHLAKVQSEMYERRWERFYVKRPARIVAVNRGLSGITMRHCEIVDISQGGAGIHVSTTIGLPEHYYLQVPGISERIGCAEVYRNGSRIGVRFIMALPENMLHRIVRADFMIGEKMERAQRR
ncbi:PilZ domain-containing protein [Ciceribacter lividus]|nr:PilZ domain-containing protein [Ciceribacter lividus]